MNSTLDLLQPIFQEVFDDDNLIISSLTAAADVDGLDTCAQEAWSIKQDSVSQFVNADDDDLLFCGMSIGYRDPKAIINSLVSDRRPIETWAKFI